MLSKKMLLSALTLLLPFTNIHSGILSNNSSHCDDDSDYDYIIVGDGTAGAVLARKLSDKSKHSHEYENRVLVLEWGENLYKDPQVLSPDVFAFSNQLTYDPFYAINKIVLVTFPTQNPPTQPFIYSDGRMWGGSSGHNGLFAVRGTPALYDSWAAYTGKSEWSYDYLLNHIILKMEEYTPDGTVANPTQRGLDGNLAITQSPYSDVSGDAFSQQLAIANNTSIKTDYNDPDLGDVMVSSHQQFITAGPDSHRSYSANAYLPVGRVISKNGEGLHGRKLRIISHALVDHVLIKNKEAIGVRYLHNGKKEDVRNVYAKKKVILCAGTTATPSILERSGIGDKNILKSLGIDVVVHNPNVGAHLLNHYGPAGLVVFPGGTAATPFLDGFVDGSSTGTYGNFGVPDGVRRIQTIALTVAPNTISISGALMHPRSEGNCHIISKDPTIYPRLDLNMYSDAPSTYSDENLTLLFYKMLQNINGATVILPPPPAYASDADLLAYAKQLDHMIVTYHCVGTARMSQSPNDGVVDGHLNVFGVKNLMCADCAIEPFIQDGNTAYAAYMIGWNAAKFIKKQEAHKRHHDKKRHCH